MTTPLLFLYFWDLSPQAIPGREDAIRNFVKMNYSNGLFQSSGFETDRVFLLHERTNNPYLVQAIPNTTRYHYGELSFSNVNWYYGETSIKVGAFLERMADELIEMNLIESYVLRNVSHTNKNSQIINNAGMIGGRHYAILITLLIRFSQKFQYNYDFDVLLPWFHEINKNEQIQAVAEYQHQDFLNQFYEDARFHTLRRNPSNTIVKSKSYLNKIKSLLGKGHG